MKFTAFSSVALFTLSVLGAELQSKPFELELTSTNSSVNGVKLNSCHEGALVEGLCLPIGFKGNAFSQTFYLNYTSAAHPNTGKLVWNNQATGTGNQIVTIPQQLTFLYSPGSNIAGLVFEGSEPLVPISFDEDDRMYISVAKVFAQGDPNDYSPVHLYRWHICLYPFTGYTYTELVWQLGEGPLIYKDCQKVGVKRVFIS